MYEHVETGLGADPGGCSGDATSQPPRDRNCDERLRRRLGHPGLPATARSIEEPRRRQALKRHGTGTFTDRHGVVPW